MANPRATAGSARLPENSSAAGRLGAVSLALLFCACSPTTTSPPAPPVSALTSCTSDAECASLGLTCDLGRLQCVCTADAMCATSKTTPYCNVFTGRCVASVAGCTAASCAAGDYCDEAVRTCKPIQAYCTTCTENAQCGPNNYCILNPAFPDAPQFCGVACGAGGTCPTGETCSDTEAGVKQCVPTNSLCGAAMTCTPDSLTPCGAGNTCSDPSQMCDTTLMECVAITSGCGTQTVCDPRTSTCVAPCGLTPGITGDQQCATRYNDPSFVCIDNVCRPAAQCTSDAQCPLNSICAKSPTQTTNFGTCELSCTTTAGCPIGELCTTDPTTMRKGCSAGCMSNSDCPLTSICQSGQCAPNHCQTKDVCSFGQQCVNNVCTAQPANCASNANGCPSGSASEEVGYYVCSSCPAGTTASCGADNPSSGFSCSPELLCICLFQRCLTECTTDTDCPQGFFCEGLSGANYCSPESAILCL